MGDSITIIALIWTIYIFLFSEADKQLALFLGRAQLMISIDSEKGSFDSQQFLIKQQLKTAEDVFYFGESLDDKDSTRNFYKKYKSIEDWKTCLLINISILTILIFANSCCIPSWWIRFHTLVTFILGGVFYSLASGLSKERLYGFIADRNI